MLACNGQVKLIKCGMSRLRITPTKAAILSQLLERKPAVAAVFLHGMVCEVLGKTVPMTSFRQNLSALEGQGCVIKVGGSPSRVELLAEIEEIFADLEADAEGGAAYPVRGYRLTAKGRMFAKLLRLETADSSGARSAIVQDLLREVVALPEAAVV